MGKGNWRTDFLSIPSRSSTCVVISKVEYTDISTSDHELLLNMLYTHHDKQTQEGGRRNKPHATLLRALSFWGHFPCLVLQSWYPAATSRSCLLKTPISPNSMIRVAELATLVNGTT